MLFILGLLKAACFNWTLPSSMARVYVRTRRSRTTGKLISYSSVNLSIEGANFTLRRSCHLIASHQLTVNHEIHKSWLFDSSGLRWDSTVIRAYKYTCIQIHCWKYYWKPNVLQGMCKVGMAVRRDWQGSCPRGASRLKTLQVTHRTGCLWGSLVWNSHRD